MFSRTILLLLSFVHHCFGHYYTPYMPSLPFEHLHTNTAIDGPQPWYNGEVPSKDHCFDKCVKNFTDCVYVQYKEVTATTWLCKLYGVISDLSNYLVSTHGVMLAQAIHKNIGCEDWSEMGYPAGVRYIFQNRRKARAWCLGSGWTRIQLRNKGSANFTQNWEGYKEGFGDPSGEFWLGNEMLHQLTKDRQFEIYIRAWAFDGTYVGAKFRGFWIEDEANNYRLHTGTYYEGCVTCSDDWLALNGTYFSTPDRDNDIWAEGHCGMNQTAGWWMTSCGRMQLNGVHSQTATIPFRKGIYWKGFKGDFISLKAIAMLIRPVI